ncbi:MAG: type I-C CRISPR-associated protein Cas5c [Firmicutes bacterium]|nr:type I-C CRISPR-associated protein Cas5c [Bacillota bacterium]
MEKKNSISFRLYGRTALFSDPITRAGGEKFTYMIPTYQALKGVCESIYWKPTIIWVVDRVRIMNPIRTESKGMRVSKMSGGNDLSIYMYLINPEYQVEAHFEWNEQREDLAHDRVENKHYFISKRMLERGGRRDIFLGARECQGYVEPCKFGECKGYYDDESMSFGVMVHGINYPDEIGGEKLQTRLWNAQMKNGIIDFIRPEECTMVTDTVDYKTKEFVPGKNFSGLEEFEREGWFDAMDDAAL